jgi:hypothetical protein
LIFDGPEQAGQANNENQKSHPQKQQVWSGFWKKIAVALDIFSEKINGQVAERINNNMNEYYREERSCFQIDVSK